MSYNSDSLHLHKHVLCKYSYVSGKYSYVAT